MSKRRPAPVLLLQSLNAAACGSENHMLSWNQRCSAMVRVVGASGQPLPQSEGELCLQSSYVLARTHSAEWIEPKLVISFNAEFAPSSTGSLARGIQKVRRVCDDAIAKEARRRNARHDEWVHLHIDSGADD